ncbi:MAG: hypothetical protein PVJ70_04385 [Syntrophobacterales bacterium]|jgi:hypothetical protein
MRLPDQEKAQARHKGYDEQSHKKDTQKWQGSGAEAEHGLFKSEAGYEEVHPYGRGGITDLQVSEENDAQVEKVDVVTLGYGNNKWCHNNKGGIDIKYTSHQQQKDI